VYVCVYVYVCVCMCMYVCVCMYVCKYVPHSTLQYIIVIIYFAIRMWIGFNYGAFPKSCRVSLNVKGINLLKLTGYVMHQQFNIQQLYALPTLYLCVLYLSENKHRLVPLTA
jgi:hypothetical protein